MRACICTAVCIRCTCIVSYPLEKYEAFVVVLNAAIDQGHGSNQLLSFDWRQSIRIGDDELLLIAARAS